MAHPLSGDRDQDGGDRASLNERMPIIGSTYHRPRASPALMRLRSAALALRARAASRSRAARRRRAAGGRLDARDRTAPGDGHGVGMSQDGALGYAQHGYSYQAILAHYYTGTTLGQAPAETRRARAGRLEGASASRSNATCAAWSPPRCPPSWPLAALEAQAIASRTYALTAHAGGSRFDVYSDTRSQVYRRRRRRNRADERRGRRDRRADRPLRGQARDHLLLRQLRRDDRGRRERFPGAEPSRGCSGVRRPLRQRAAVLDWKHSISFAAAAARLRGLVKGSFRGIEVLTRGVSPRIVTAEVLGSRGAHPGQRPGTGRRAWAWRTPGPYFSVKSGCTVTREPDLSRDA